MWEYEILGQEEKLGVLMLKYRVYGGKGRPEIIGFSCKSKDNLKKDLDRMVDDLNDHRNCIIRW